LAALHRRAAGGLDRYATVREWGWRTRCAPSDHRLNEVRWLVADSRRRSIAMSTPTSGALRLFSGSSPTAALARILGIALGLSITSASPVFSSGRWRSQLPARHKGSAPYAVHPVELGRLDPHRSRASGACEAPIRSAASPPICTGPRLSRRARLGVTFQAATFGPRAANDRHARQSFGAAQRGLSAGAATVYSEQPAASTSTAAPSQAPATWLDLTCG